MSTIRWGIIGCGDVADRKSGPGFYNSSGSDLVAVMRRDLKLAEKFARRHGVKKFYDQADRLVQDPEVDAVYVATPPVHHKEYAMQCCRAGKPVYVEKPMAIDYRSCLEMIREAEKNNVPLYVAYYRRALPKFLTLKKLLENDEIGEPATFHTLLTREPKFKDNTPLPWRLRPEISGGGLFVDLACHLIDVYDFLFGPVKKAKGEKRNQASVSMAEDVVNAAFSFENGVTGSGTWYFNASAKYDRNEILGTRGRIIFSNHGTAPLILENHKGKKKISYKVPRYIQQPFIQKVVDALNGKVDFPSNAGSAARISRIMEEI